MRRSAAAGMIAVALLAGTAAGAPAADPRIDRIFARWDHAGSPGCALGVARAGRTLLARGYGSANLEHRIAITPDTVFDIGSVSKQFTAMSIVLLAQAGKLSLDDEIHRYIPELPDYGAPVRLRQMLHHASGLPSYTDLFDLAGVPEASLSTDADALRLIARQRTLNFPPGQQFLYSDTNYFLLSLVVRRVSGQSLRAFAQQHIFGPLGMRSTHFHDDHTMIVPHRATGHSPREGGGFAIDMSNFEELGDGSVMTSVADMLRWDRNFREPAVGGREAIALLQEPGVRNDGSATPYAMGLIRDRYRGRERVQHTGEWVGYRAGFARFAPDDLSVVVLCNTVGEIDTLGLVEQVADVMLPAPTPAPSPAPDPAAFAGLYWDARTQALLRFAVRAGALALDEDGAASPLTFIGNGTYALGNSATRFAFSGQGEAARATATSDDGDPLVLARVAANAAARTTDPDTLAGTYYSDALGISWTLSRENGRLVRHQWLAPPQALRPQFGDVFTGDLSEGRYTLRFTREPDGAVTGFTVATPMVRPVTFRRCVPADPEMSALIATDCRVVVPAIGEAR